MKKWILRITEMKLKIKKKQQQQQRNKQAKNQT